MTVLVALLLATELAGILGALLAIPVAGVIQVVLRDIWHHRGGQPVTDTAMRENAAGTTSPPTTVHDRRSPSPDEESRS